MLPGIAAMAPRTLKTVITGFAYLAGPLWAVAVGGYFGGLPDRAMVLLTGAAVTSTACALRVWQEDRTDARVAAGIAGFERHEAELALLAGTMMDSGLVKVAPVPPIPQPAGECLRLVRERSS